MISVDVQFRTWRVICEPNVEPLLLPGVNENALPNVL